MSIQNKVSDSYLDFHNNEDHCNEAMLAMLKLYIRMYVLIFVCISLYEYVFYVMSMYVCMYV